MRKPHTRQTNKIRLSAKIQHSPTLKDLVIEIDKDVPIKDIIINKEEDFLAGTSKKKKAQKQSGFHRNVVEAKATIIERSMKKGRHSNLDVLFEVIETLK